jgi:hypothetical protein
MPTYKSFGHCSKNEDGKVEVNIEYNETFLQWLFNKPTTKEVWVRSNGTLNWRNKETGEFATLNKWTEIEALYCYSCDESNKMVMN